MDWKFLWLSMTGGALLLVYGVRELYLRGDWVIFILSLLILAFTASAMLKGRRK